MRLGHSHGRSDSQQGNAQHFQAGEAWRGQNKIKALKVPSIARLPKWAEPNEGLNLEAAFVTKDWVFNLCLEALAWRAHWSPKFSLTPP